MTLSIEDLYDKALALSADIEDNFWDLGRALRQLRHRDPALFQQIVKNGKLGRRKAYYLVEVSRIFEPLPVHRSRLRKIGWTKLQLIAKHVTPDNLDALLQLAESSTAKDLERQMRGEKPLGNAHCVLMYFSPKQYAEFKRALLMNGATESGRGLVDKEKALINALRKAEPGVEKAQPAEFDTPEQPPEASKQVEGGSRNGGSDPLIPGEVGLLSRVVRARAISEDDLVRSWGTGSWAAEALDGLLERRLVVRLDDVSHFIGQKGLPSKPGPWIIPTEEGIAQMRAEHDVAFPPSGAWLECEGVLLNAQPADLLLQYIEFVFARDGLMPPGADVRPADVLRKDLLARLSEIKLADDGVAGGR